MCDTVGIAREVATAALPQRGPERILDLCIRSGPFGDRFGMRSSNDLILHLTKYLESWHQYAPGLRKRSSVCRVNG